MYPNYRHGLSKHRLYNIFLSMHDRCYNPNKPQYKDWGGRGISVCDRWNKYVVGLEQALNNFITDMYPSFKEGLTLDRTDNNKNYSPDNCTWQTKQHQSENARSVKSVLQIDINTNEIIAEYKSCHEAGRKTKTAYQSILSCCHNEPKYKTANGYRWKFKED